MEENSIASIRERLNGIYKYAAENQAAFDAETKAIMERMHRIVSNKALIIWIIIGFVLWDVLAASRFIFPDATIPILMIIAGGTLSFKRISKHRLTRAHRGKQLKMSCQALHNAPPNRT